MCEASIGFHGTNQFMKCVAAIDENTTTYEITSEWVKTKESRSAKYEFSDQYVELFINNKSIGKPYQHLVSSGMCQYIEH